MANGTVVFNEKGYGFSASKVSCTSPTSKAAASVVPRKTASTSSLSSPAARAMKPSTSAVAERSFTADPELRAPGRSPGSHKSARSCDGVESGDAKQPATASNLSPTRAALGGENRP